MNIIDMVEDILDRYSIRYRHMVVRNVGTKNTIITDGANVLVKMKSYDKSFEEFSSDVNFTMHNEDAGFKLLIPEVVQPHKRNIQAAFSVWKYESCLILNDQTITPAQSRDAVDELVKIHRSVRYPELQRSTSDITSRFALWFNSVQFKTLSAQLQHQLKKFYETLAQPAEMLVHPPVFNSVVAHGKALPNRLNIQNDGRIRWSDFETVRLTRREYDLASLKLSLKISGANLPAWDAVEEQYSHHYPDLNDSVVEAFIGLLITERAVHYSSQVSTDEREAELIRFLRDASPMLEGKKLNYLKLPALHGYMN